MAVFAQFAGSVQLRKTDDTIRILSDLEDVLSYVEARLPHDPDDEEEEEFLLDQLSLDMLAADDTNTYLSTEQLEKMADNTNFILHIQGNATMHLSEAIEFETALLSLGDHVAVGSFIAKTVDDVHEQVFIGDPNDEFEARSKLVLSDIRKKLSCLGLDDMMLLQEEVAERLAWIEDMEADEEAKRETAAEAILDASVT